MIKRVSKATGEYATSETMVWWDMDNCPLPNGYDPSQLGPRIDTELKNLGYNGPVTIVAAGNLYGIPNDFLKTLSSTGLVLHHSTSGLSDIVPSYLDSRTSHSPLSIMLITTNSDLLDSIIREIYMGDLVGYNLLLAYPPSYELEDPHPSSLVSLGGEWLWDRSSLLKVSGVEEEETRRLVDTTRSCDMFLCASCPVSSFPSFETFIDHLGDEMHKTIVDLSDDTVEMMIRVDAEKLEALKQSQPYIDLLEAKKLAFERYHKYLNDPGKMFQANNLESDDEEYVSPLLQMFKESQKNMNKNSECLKNDSKARRMTKANNLEIDNEEYVSPLQMIKESQKKKKSSERVKNEREARRIKYEKYFSEKTLISKANNLKIDIEASESTLLPMFEESQESVKWLMKKVGSKWMTKASY